MLDQGDFDKVMQAARELRAARHILTAGYGGMDVAIAAYERSGVDSEFGVYDFSAGQVHALWDAFHGTETETSRLAERVSYAHLLPDGVPDGGSLGKGS
jgi:RsiW-degrading membrane proteinase PrsW (M82 family)